MKTVIHENTSLKIYKNDLNEFILTPSDSSNKRIPVLRNDFIKELKDINEKFIINLKTGGPLIKNAQQVLNTVLMNLSPEDRQYIETEVFGEQDSNKKEKLKNFSSIIKTLYFSDKNNKFLENEPNNLYWTEETWRSFKEEEVFAHFIKHNFIKDFNHLTYNFKKKKKDDVITSLDEITIKNETFKRLLEKFEYKPNDALLTWKWKNTEEYKRLKIRGKYIQEMKSFGDTYYWIPIVLNDTKKSLEMIPCHSSGLFQIYEDEVMNIICLAPFKTSDNKIDVDKIITGVFKGSYLHQILKTIDKILNETILELFEKFSMIEFYEFKKINF